jgi:hypothetical protein
VLLHLQQQSQQRGVMSFFDEFNLRQVLSRLLESHTEQCRLGSDRFRAIETHLKHLKDLFMALTPEVQALVDQDAKLKASVDAMKAKQPEQRLSKGDPTETRSASIISSHLRIGDFDLAQVVLGASRDLDQNVKRSVH